MLPLACQLWQAGKAVSVENAQPRYLRNEVTWKNFLVANKQTTYLVRRITSINSNLFDAEQSNYQISEEGLCHVCTNEACTDKKCAN